MKIQIFTAGGTIDKVYSEEKGTINFSFGEPAMKEIVGDKIKLNFEYEIENLLAKDSLDMTEDDRQLIKSACEKTKTNKILITHGTDTMIKTAEVLSTIKDKAIVITGASQPYKFIESNAEFNIGCALGALNVLDNGIYIAMNGRIYAWDKCQKLETGIFTEK